MRVLMLSTDQNIFKTDSAARERMKDYGTIADELHIIVYTNKLTTNNSQPTTLTDNVFIYPTNSKFKFFYFRDAYKISKPLVVSRKLSVITAQDPFETGLVGYLLKRKFQLPLQIQIHTDFLSPYFWRESIKNKLRVLLAKWLIPKADGIRVVSQRIADSLRSKIRDQRSKITILPIFVDVQKIKNTPVKTDLHKKYPNHDFIILMASRLTREKNIGMVIEAISNIKNPLLLIVGDGPEIKNLQLTTYNLELQNSVKFEPWSSDLISYYKTADLLLLTSNYEGYGLTAVEAAAADLPVVMTDVGVAIGKVIPVGNIKVLTEVLEDLIVNKIAREKIIKEQNAFFRYWPTLDDYLQKLKQSWQNCCLSPKR